MHTLNETVVKAKTSQSLEQKIAELEKQQARLGATVPPLFVCLSTDAPVPCCSVPDRRRREWHAPRKVAVRVVKARWRISRSSLLR